MEKRVFLWILSLFVIFACTQTPEEKGTGYLTLNISQGTGLKSDVDITDFILRISDGRVDVIKGRIADLPPEIALPEGLYTIEAYSKEFDAPKFEEPFYSGKTTVEIEAGETREVSLICSLGNAGIQVVWSSLFSNLFNNYYAIIECDEGYLHYSSAETRTGYFLPGTVSVIIHADGQTINSGTITLSARDMVTAHLRPKYEESPSGGLTIEIIIDETVNEREIEIIVDPDDTSITEPNSQINPYNIAQAINRQNENAVWVTGYIVGSNPSSGHVFYNMDNWQNTNIVIADDISEINDMNVIFVQLPAGQHRDRLNLISIPENLHRKVLIRGNLTRYFQRPGLMNPSSSSIL